jgi:primary-amine oxidase
MPVQSLLVAILAAVPVLARPDANFWRRVVDARDTDTTCDIYADAPRTEAPKSNVWSQITTEDVKAVWDLVHAPATGLNLTNPDNATLTDNYVYFIDTLCTFLDPLFPSWMQLLMP